MVAAFNPPWLTDEEPGRAPIVADFDGRVICAVRGDDPGLAALLSLAPEFLRELGALVHVLQRYDPRYCATHSLPPPTPEELAEALCDAVTLLAHARDLGVPISAPLEVTQ